MKNRNIPAKDNQKPKNYKLALALAGASLLSLLIYFGIVALSNEILVYIPIIEIYTVLIALLVCASLVVNAGMEKTPPTPDQLPQKWDEEKKQKFIDSFPARKKAVKILAFITISLCVPLFVDVIQIWLGGLFS